MWEEIEFYTLFFSVRHLQPLGVWTASLWKFRDHTQGRTTVGRTPLDEWSARRRALYLTTHTTLTTENNRCPRRDSNQQSQQAIGRRPLGHWDQQFCSLNIWKRNKEKMWVTVMKRHGRKAEADIKKDNMLIIMSVIAVVVWEKENKEALRKTR